MRRAVLVEWVLAGLCALPMAAAAQGNVFYGCAREDGTLRTLSVNVPPECKSSQTLVSWAEAADPTTLPSGATLRGIWAPSTGIATAIAITGSQISTISFPLQLAATPTFHPLTHWMLQNESTTDCPGVIGGLPQAAAGHLCVYQTNSDASSAVESKTAIWSRLGVKLFLQAPVDAGMPVAEGLWAVTAP